VTECDELKLPILGDLETDKRAREHCRDECEHAGDIMCCRLKSLDFPLLSEFSTDTRWSVAVRFEVSATCFS
jgi:hypothetical protein